MVVVPTGKVDPGDNPAVCEMLAPLQLSFAVGTVHVTTLPQEPAELDCEMLEGQPEMVGAWVSVTVTVNEQVEVFPEASVAV
jgi:hypothetical protein